MAKSTKSKKQFTEELPVAEPIKEEIQETVIEETPAPEILDAEPITEIKDEPEIIVGKIEKLELTPKEAILTVQELTKEEKILKFIEGSMGNRVQINGVLKTLYPSSVGQPPQWTQQNVSKQIKALLQAMVEKGQIAIYNNSHLRLGSPYFSGVEQTAANYTIDTLQLFVEK